MYSLIELSVISHIKHHSNIKKKKTEEELTNETNREVLSVETNDKHEMADGFQFCVIFYLQETHFLQEVLE